jgi:hypothetical protein
MNGGRKVFVDWVIRCVGFEPAPAKHLEHGLRLTNLSRLTTAFLFYISVGDVYGYLVGIPTRATIVQCTPAKGGDICTGTWSVAGVSHTSAIQPHGYHPAGSSLDVRARGGTTYTSPWGHWNLYMFSLFAIHFLVMGLGLAPADPPAIGGAREPLI